MVTQERIWQLGGGKKQYQSHYLIQTNLNSSRVDLSVLPLLFLGLFVFQLDRMNLASALTGGFRKAINVDQATINLGNQMMFLGIVVLEIPSNMLLQKVYSLYIP